MSLETQENRTSWRDIPGFCRDIPAAPDKFEKGTVAAKMITPEKLKGNS